MIQSIVVYVCLNAGLLGMFAGLWALDHKLRAR